MKEFENRENIGANVYAKIEYGNPFGSIKDRVALQIIEEAERNGYINCDSHIIEATSGNMGIALAAICEIKGYPCTIIMPENMSQKRKEIIKNYGANLILAPKENGMNGSINLVQDIISENREYYYTNQFNNIAAINSHILFTAPEIYNQLNGDIDIIIAGIGTAATIMGLALYFKQHNSSIKIIGILPSNYPHKIQGIGAGFEPPMLNRDLIDDVICVDDFEAFEEQMKIYKNDKIAVGISSGAVISGLKKYVMCNDCSKKNIVLIFPDGLDRYQ